MLMTHASLTQYRLLGRSGVRVSPIALGSMMMGEPWGSDPDASRAIFDHYVERGGNFVDTADYYAAGRSEEIIGTLAQGRRDQLVISTKYSILRRKDDPNSGGNHRKSMMLAVEESLRRLRTDRIDLYFLHIWDGYTPTDEILRAFDDLVCQGKILYLGISDTPAWRVAEMQTMAELRGWSRFVALQAEYNLVQRTAERELIPCAAAMGIGVLPWSPLAGGVLSGAYGGAQDEAATPTNTRRQKMYAMGRVTERALQIAAAVGSVAAELGRTHAQVALAWTLHNPAVTAPVIGPRTLDQLEDSLGAVELGLSVDQLGKLGEASQFELGFPQDFLASASVKALLPPAPR
jgi:aryl-alcohol dehydrogenase-like predicted oxidoreductase